MNASLTAPLGSLLERDPKTNLPPQAVIYVRVNTDRDAEIRLLHYLVPCRRYAQEKGFVIVGEFQDIGPGDNLDRPGLSAMRQAVSETAVSALIVYNLSQLVRSGYHQKNLFAQLSRRAIQVHSVSSGKVI